MSILSDYKQHVSGPTEAGLRKTIATQRARILALEAQVAGMGEALEYIASLNCGWRQPETEEENNLGQCVAELQRVASEALSRLAAAKEPS